MESLYSPSFPGTVVLRRLTRGGEGQHAADGPRESVVTMLALFLCGPPALCGSGNRPAPRGKMWRGRQLLLGQGETIEPDEGRTEKEEGGSAGELMDSTVEGP